MDHHTTLTRLLALALIVGSGQTLAQTDQPAIAVPVAEPPALTALPHILNILDQVAVVAAGKGFKSIQLGDPFQQLQRVWGSPQSRKQFGLLKKTQRWRYQLDDNTVIDFIGKQTIKEIHLYGNRRSIARTRAGMGFNTEQATAQRLYGKAKISKKSKVENWDYPEKGIRFVFKSAADNKQLAEIAIFQAENRTAN